ncbi:MAG: hypothetical protein WAV72_18070, partial [Bradyrhizobium sp.]
ALIAQEIAANARALVDAGANSVVIGSAGLSVMASAAGLAKVPDLEVPIFDCLSVGFKTAELRSQLQRKMGVPSHSAIGWGERLPEADVARLRKLFELSGKA